MLSSSFSLPVSIPKAAMPLKRIRSLSYRWLHFLQPDLILTVFSCSSPALATGDTESIELTSFLGGLDSGILAVLAGGGTGAGHSWAEVGTQNPTWCDLCRELIWGLYQVRIEGSAMSSR